MKSKNRYITTPRHAERIDKKTKTDFVSFIFFSENHGYRMKSHGPIPLLSVNGKTIIERQIEAIKAAFLHFEIIVCSGFQTEKIVNFIKENFKDINVRVVENQVHYNSNCCESARLCLNNTVNSKVMLCNGNVILDPMHFSMIDTNQSCVIVQEDNMDDSFEIGAISTNHSLERLSLGIKKEYWVEIIYLSNQEAINDMYSVISNPEYKNRFIFEAINEISNKQNIQVTPNEHSPIYKVNNIKTLKKVQST